MCLQSVKWICCCFECGDVLSWAALFSFWHGCVCVCVHVCVCFASVSLGRGVAPRCDCVYSFITLWAALPSTHHWRCQQMERGRWGKALAAGRNRHSWSAALSLSPLPPLGIGHIRTFSSHMLNYRADFSMQIPNLTRSSCSWTACHRPRSSYCSVREHRSHGPLLATTVLRSSKISWTSCSRFLVVVVVVVAIHPHWMPQRTVLLQVWL